MLNNYIKIPPQMTVHDMVCGWCCSAFSFSIFIYALNLFFQRDRANSWDLFLSSTDGWICASHNRNQSGKATK